jgi:polynucleotide 5'-hydroxyl-kinase GRC3/NOL9
MYELGPEETTLVTGPASVVLCSGSAETLGAQLKVGQRIIVRSWKLLPVEVPEHANLDIRLGEGASIEKIKGSTIPQSWRSVADEVTASKMSLVMNLGGIDSGKSTLATFITNKAVRAGIPVQVIDADLGQSELGPPGTVARCQVTRPITDLFRLNPQSMYFVGDTSPGGVTDDVIKGVKTILDDVRDFSGLKVVNTDGWIDGEAATEFKTHMACALRPDIVCALEAQNELSDIIAALENHHMQVRRLEVPTVVKRRNREHRRELREQVYHKFIRNATVRTVQFDWVKIEDRFYGSSSGLEAGDALLRLRGLEGLLVGLADEEGRFLGIGRLTGVEKGRRVARIRTSVLETVRRIKLGRIRLDEYGRELEIIRNESRS